MAHIDVCRSVTVVLCIFVLPFQNSFPEFHKILSVITDKSCR